MTEGNTRAWARGQGWASWALAALAAGAVVAGLAIAGGPSHARKERRDDTRSAELSQLSSHISCLVGDTGPRELPSDFGPTEGCPGPVPLTDRHSGKDYRIEWIGDGKYRLCADYELPPRDGQRPYWGSDRRDGDCLIYSLPVPRNLQPAPQPGD